MKDKELGIYIHIPFCKKKCYYCDFISYCNKDNLIDRYIKSVICEIQNFKEKYQDKYHVNTLYIGGGTPSYIDAKYIKLILDAIKINIQDLEDIKEITIEVNPGTVNEEKLNIYKKLGINRLSIGLQSTNDTLLKEIGRIHNFKEFLETYNLARNVGFDNINIDLMLGLPSQTIQDLKESLLEIIKLNPEHISVYSLILEENTHLYNLVNSKKLILPSDELERNMYWYVKDTLELNNYIQYEISNFSKKGYESKHNLDCWTQKEYIGFGAASHSYIENKRFSNLENIEEYIENIENGNIENNIIVHEIQDNQSMEKEYMMLGLRKIEGISIQEFKNKFGENPIYLFRNELNKLVNEELLEIDSNYIKLTNKGLDLANIVWQEFV